MVVGTPSHLTSSAFRELRSNTADSTLTKKAKSFIQDEGYLITPLSKNKVNLPTVDKGQAKPAAGFLQDTKAIYSWKVEIVSDNEVVAKRLIGKTSQVSKRLHSYFSTIRAGHTTLARAILKSYEQKLKREGLNVSFGVIYSNVPDDIIGRVEKIVITAVKALNPEHLLNQRAGGGGASQRKPLSKEDYLLVHSVAQNILQDLHTPAKDTGTFVRQKGRVVVNLCSTMRRKSGVVYAIENSKTGMCYIGKTQNPLRLRLSQHLSAINTSKRAKKIHLAIQARPEDFQIRVLYQAPKDKTHILEEVEHACILKRRSFTSCGYNENKGTTCVHKVDVQMSPGMQSVVKKVQKTFKCLENILPSKLAF